MAEIASHQTETPRAALGPVRPQLRAPDAATLRHDRNSRVLTRPHPLRLPARSCARRRSSAPKIPREADARTARSPGMSRWTVPLLRREWPAHVDAVAKRLPNRKFLPYFYPPPSELDRRSPIPVEFP